MKESTLAREGKYAEIASLCDEYDSNSAMMVMIAAISDHLEWKEMIDLFKEKPKLRRLQEDLLNRYIETRDCRYLHVFDKYAIEAKRANNGVEVYPLSHETYERFDKLRGGCKGFSHRYIFQEDLVFT